MLNTTKLLYILPNVAYVAELLAGKKPHTFGVHAFRQINGEFLEKDSFIGRNVLKLFSKLEEGEYTLVLPDSFFTNTIISIDETDDEKIQEYVANTTLPQLKLSKTSHHIESYVLTEFKGASQVQIAALEKKRLAPIRAALSQTSVTLAATISISWSIKSLISLEPSASVIQAGAELYAAKQYIGVDETNNATVTDAKVLAEAIKGLKGSDANLQTVYLVSNELVQNTLEEELSSVIPIQQLASQKDDDTQMPSYVRHILEAAGRTLSIKEYPVPKFILDTASDEDLKLFNIESLASDTTTGTAATIEEPDEPAEDILPTPASAPITSATASKSEAALPEIAMLGEEMYEEKEVEKEEEAPLLLSTEDEQEKTDLSKITLDPEKITDKSPDTSALGANIATGVASATAISALSAAGASATVGASTSAVANEATVTDPSNATGTNSDTASKVLPDLSVKATEVEKEAAPEVTLPESKEKITPSPLVTPPPKSESTSTETDSIDLSKFSNHTTVQAPAGKPLAVGSLVTPSKSPQKTTIKNKGGVQNMFKMILITTAVFIVTVAVGVGVGLGILSLTNKSTPESPVVVETPAPVAVATPEPTPEATPAAEIVKSEYDILVVNATTKAGYAGTISDLLDDYGTIRSGNARGTYETPGMYVGFKEEVPGLLEALQEDTELSLKIDAEAVETEDAAGTYDAVIILAE